MVNIQLHHADCFDIFPQIPDNSIDLVLCDPPYGTTACKWDTVLDLDLMWEQLKRVTHDRTAIVLCAAQPFTSVLVCSNLKMFKYQWVWDKYHGTGFLNAKRQPLRINEDICVFYKKQPCYNPQMRFGFSSYDVKQGFVKSKNYGYQQGRAASKSSGTRYPVTIVQFKRDQSRHKKAHPTQKPVPLMEYMIKTYSNPGSTVLDFTMGSGTTGVAAKKLRRHFIGIELDPDYFQIAQERIYNTPSLLRKIRKGLYTEPVTHEPRCVGRKLQKG